MKIELIQPPHPESIEDRLDPPLGLLYIAAVLEQNGHEVTINDLSGIKEEDWKINNADIYGITVYATSLVRCQRIAALCKKENSKSIVVVGGPHVSALPNETLESESNFDVAVIGEGEYAFLDIIEDFKKGTLKRIYQHKVNNLDDLPFPARHLVDLNTYKRRVYGHKSISICSTRGCPFKCVFCANDKMYDRFKFISPEKVAEEIKGLISKYGIKYFYFYDNIFSLNRKRLHRLCDLLEPLDITFFYYDRVGTPEEDCKKIYQAGGRVCFLGVETGFQKLLDKMNKGITVEQARKSILMLQEIGISARVSLMFGFPGETRKTWEETKKFIEESNPDQVMLNTFVPFPGCDVWDNPSKYGITKIDKDFSKYALCQGEGKGGVTFETKELSFEEFSKLLDEAVAWWKSLPIKGGAPVWAEKWKRPS